LIAPLKIGSQIVGILTLDHDGEAHQYTLEEQALTAAIAKLIALVIERERLLRERAEARASELALRAANRQMEEFLGMVSHELKTPLTSIKGNTQLAVRQLKNSLQGLERILGLYENSERQTRRLGRLVDDLLDVSRSQAGLLDLQLARAGLPPLIAEAVEEQRQIWPTRRIDIQLPSEPLPALEIDGDRIKQVISNYLTNALKYSDEDRPVSITLKLEAGAARILVEDRGPGLSQEEQEQIWDRFYRSTGIEVRSAPRSSTVGLGLGLYISRMIIEQHAGTVGVTSRPGEGSTFWFMLPLPATTEEPETLAESAG
jgi:signal transduction histidine kinase